MAVIEVASLDEEGLPVCRIADQPPSPEPAPKILFTGGALAVGDRALVRLERRTDGIYRANLIRRLERERDQIVGVFVPAKDGGFIEPVERRSKQSYAVRTEDFAGALAGDLVLAAPIGGARFGTPRAKIVERIGPLDDPRSISLLAIRLHEIPTDFSAAALAEAAAAIPVTADGRTDLRSLKLVTIDGADARDFDDAVWAEPDPDGSGGWHVLVAIADVAWYVRPGSALDLAAAERGNSVYFPDRVVPMLPETLSNGLCSLQPDVERACLAIHIWFDGNGRTSRHEIVRGIMRSAARLTYEQAQTAIDDPAAPHGSLMAPLDGAYRALFRARQARGTLDLDLPERKIVLAADGSVERIERRMRLDSHRLIEEFMIAANVAAAESLANGRMAALYRVHDAPDPERLEVLRTVLEAMAVPGLKLARGQAPKPALFAQLLASAEGRPEAPLINELVLRSQAQAAYAPLNIGHFGLALRRYAHFTSPIRRYADLQVHRALIALLNLGTDGASVDHAALEELGEHLCVTERRAALAERTAGDRYLASYMRNQVGVSFAAKVSGVAKYGLFVSLNDTGADGLVPAALLPGDYYVLDERTHALVGQRTRRRYALGDRMEVRLTEIDAAKSSLVFAPLDSGGAPSRPGGTMRGLGNNPRKFGGRRRRVA